ncbi:MAG: hypothetical protein EOP11_17430 [Proteobacteria bacterium]|nr:MAG: hypothetical protein EOP11_17430 [Pseudomonadota bacterium]
MKAFFLTLFLAPTLLHAAGPDYAIPPGATSAFESCTTFASVQNFQGGQWGEAQDETSSESHRIFYWNDGENFYSLQRGANGYPALYTRIYDEVPGRIFTRRKKDVTFWTKENGSWNREDRTFEQTIRRPSAAPVRITETSGSETYSWEIISYGEGDYTVTERTLTNPEAKNTDSRRVAGFLEICRFRSTALRL